MLEWRVELQKLAGVALRTFIPQETGRNTDDYGRMIWGLEIPLPSPPEISHTPEQHVHHTSAFRPLPFPLDRVPLSYPPSFSPFLSDRNGHQPRRVCENSAFNIRVAPGRDYSWLHLTGLFFSRNTAEQPLIEKETYRLTRREPTHRRTRTRQFGGCHPGRNTNVIRVSLL